MKLLILFSIVVSLVVLTCTSNPLFDDEQKAFDRRTINGNIRLQDDSSPEEIYVWIEDLNVSASSAANGDFLLRLPNTSDYQGLNGVFTIFFYMGNYGYATANALIRDGLFEYGERDISNDGKLTGVSPLSKLLTITTTILPEALTIDEPDTLTIRLIVDNVSSGVTVRTYKDRENRLAGFYIKQAGAANTSAQGILLNSYRPVTDMVSSPTVIETSIPWDGNRLEPGSTVLTAGEYEVFPYVYLVQENLPPELITSFGQDAGQFSTDYLNIPFKQTTAPLSILN